MPRRTPDRLHAGRRDRLVTIRQLTEGVDANSGEPTETWTPLVCDMPTSKTDVSGDEEFKADQVSARFDTEWGMGWHDDMDPDRFDVPKVRDLQFGQRVFDIVECVEVGRKAGLIIRTIASTKRPS